MAILDHEASLTPTFSFEVPVKPENDRGSDFACFYDFSIGFRTVVIVQGRISEQ